VWYFLRGRHPLPLPFSSICLLLPGSVASRLFTPLSRPPPHTLSQTLEGARHSGFGAPRYVSRAGLDDHGQSGTSGTSMGFCFSPEHINISTEKTSGPSATSADQKPIQRLVSLVTQSNCVGVIWCNRVCASPFHPTWGDCPVGTPGLSAGTAQVSHANLERDMKAKLL
jgi:hypothetical protein